MSQAAAPEISERMEVWEQLIEYHLCAAQNATDGRLLVRCYNQVTSTMNKARELLADLRSGQSALVLAAQQSEGRGRLGRLWHPAEDGFYGTFILCDKFEISKLSGFSLAVGTVLQRVFQELGCATFLKWPNDVLDRTGRKVAGILVEVLPAGELGYVLVGIGINLRGRPQQISSATSLDRIINKRLIAPELAPLIALPLLEAWSTFRTYGFGPFRQAWSMAAYNLGKEIEVANGDQLLRGTFEGVNECGSLLLNSDGAQKQISSGEVIC